VQAERSDATTHGANARIAVFGMDPGAFRTGILVRCSMRNPSMTPKFSHESRPPETRGFAVPVDSR
jgi:hypothetical protein